METYDWWDGLNLVQEEGYSTHLITDHAIAFIEDNQKRPFCLYVAHEAVHSPWQGPDDPIVRGPNKEPGAKLDLQRGFREMLIELDRGVGRIVETIDRLELNDRTLVFFCSDNGPAGGSAGPLRGRKGSNWEGGHRVPAIARWPGTIDADATCDELCITLDLMPTMLKIAGASPPTNHQFDGIDLMPVMTAGKKLGGRKLFWNGVAMREGPWKLITPKGANTPRLYDLAADLAESKNLAQRYPPRVESMAKDLVAWTREVSPK
jgi:arylsulfatase A-like enzyme